MKRKTFHRCTQCGNTEEFEEQWRVKVTQNLKEKERDYTVVEKTKRTCSKCGSSEIESI